MLRVIRPRQDLHAARTRAASALPVLRGVTLDRRAPANASRWHGPSGAGKSTLLRSLYGNYRAAARHDPGAPSTDAWVDMAGAEPRDIARRAPPHDRLSSASSCASFRACRRSTSSPSRCCGWASTAERGARTRRALLLARLGIPERLWSLAPATFSGGEQQRVNIARGFIADYPVLLLDEPTASLDAANRDVVVDLIRERATRHGHRRHLPRPRGARGARHPYLTLSPCLSWPGAHA